MKASTYVGKPAKTFSPPLKNPSQKLAWKQWPDVDLMFLVGPAGTGKTYAVWGGVLAALSPLIALAGYQVDAGQAADILAAVG